MSKKHICARDEILEIIQKLEQKGEKVWLGRLGKELGLGRTERSPLRYHINKLAEEGKVKITREPSEFQKELLVIRSK